MLGIKRFNLRDKETSVLMFCGKKTAVKGSCLHITSFFERFSKQFQLRAADLVFHTFMQFRKSLTNQIRVFLLFLLACLCFFGKIANNLAHQTICVAASVSSKMLALKTI
jgi:hypothetical protein